ncbi:peptidase S9A prolyl oligopeptidase domain protein beta-propeller [Syncephalis fuscata]|nr:peptidase S9A prolyl oligopeptidase domain protein beta-propeller [Syncephalis fuscata]
MRFLVVGLFALKISSCLAAGIPNPASTSTQKPSPPPNNPSNPTTSLRPPVAKKIPYTHHYHGHNLPDNYQWLRENINKNEEGLAYIKAENVYADALVKPTESLKNTLYKEFIARTEEEDEEVPWKSNGFLYFSRIRKGQAYPVLYRKEDKPDAKEVAIMDLNTMGQEQLDSGGYSPSPNNEWLNYSLKLQKDEKYAIYFKNLKTNQVFKEISGTDSAAWSADSSYVFYVTTDDTLRKNRVYRHKLGTKSDQDVIVVQENDPEFSLSLKMSGSKDYIFVISKGPKTSETYYLDSHKPIEKFKLFEPRQPGRSYTVRHFNKQFLILTNQLNGENQINQVLCSCSINGPTSAANWQVLLAHDKHIYLFDITPYSRYLVIKEYSNALPRMRVLESDANGVIRTNAAHHYIKFPEVTYTARIDASALPYNDNIIRIEYSSYVTPTSVFDYNLVTRKHTLHFIFVDRPVRPTEEGPELRKDGTNPCWLYGFGSNGAVTTPNFERQTASLLDRGFVYAIVHTRGGAEWGPAWYELDGRLLHKKNTFHDFIAVAENLIAEKYTRREIMVFEGRDEGGLLVGSAINMRPDLAKVALVYNPPVDLVNTMMDATLPMTVSRYGEWGNPSNKNYFDYMLSYSPYDNIRKGSSNSNTGVIGYNGANDTHPHNILLRTTKKGSNLGADPFYSQINDMSNDYAYVISTIETAQQEILAKKQPNK